MKDKNTEILNKIYQIAETAKTVIANLIVHVTDMPFTEELRREYGIYEKISESIIKELYKRNKDPKSANFFEKAFLYYSIKICIIKDNSLSNYAKILLNYTVNGITELLQITRRYKDVLNDPVQKFADRLLKAKEEFEVKLKEFI